MGVASDDPRVARCAFAKLDGIANFPDPGHFLVKKYEIFLGRRSKSSTLDVILGDNMNISRKHAKIFYNFEKRVFQLAVLGKNGVTVDGVLYTPTSGNLTLPSKSHMQIGDSSFYFLLPVSEAVKKPLVLKPSAAKKRKTPAPHTVSKTTSVASKSKAPKLKANVTPAFAAEDREMQEANRSGGRYLDEGGQSSDDGLEDGNDDAGGGAASSHGGDDQYGQDSEDDAPVGQGLFMRQPFGVEDDDDDDEEDENDVDEDNDSQLGAGRQGEEEDDDDNDNGGRVGYLDTFEDSD